MIHEAIKAFWYTPFVNETNNSYHFFWANQEKVVGKFFSWTRYEFCVNRCDWRILAGNEQRNWSGLLESLNQYFLNKWACSGTHVLFLCLNTKYTYKHCIPNQNNWISTIFSSISVVNYCLKVHNAHLKMFHGNCLHRGCHWIDSDLCLDHWTKKIWNMSQRESIRPRGSWYHTTCMP